MTDIDPTRLTLMKAAEEIMSRRSLSELAAAFGITDPFTVPLKRPEGLREPMPEYKPEYRNGEKVYY